MLPNYDKETLVSPINLKASALNPKPLPYTLSNLIPELTLTRTRTAGDFEATNKHRRPLRKLRWLLLQSPKGLNPVKPSPVQAHAHP